MTVKATTCALDLDKAFDHACELGRVTEELIDIAWETADKHSHTVDVFGKPGTLLKVRLLNGWTFMESSVCVSSKNYDLAIGTQMAKKKVIDRMWELYAFVITTRKYAIMNQ